MKKLLVFLVLLTALFLSACNMTISFGNKNTPEPPAARTQQPTAIPRTDRSLIPPTSTPTPPGGVPGQTPQVIEAVIRDDIFTVNTRELTNSFNLPGNNTAQAWRITVEFGSTQNQRLLRWEVQGDMPAQGVYVNVYRLLNDQRAPGEGTTPFTIKSTYMYRGDVLYIRAVNNQTSPRNVTVKVTEDSDLEIRPSTATLPLGGRQEFTVTRKGTNISPSEGVTWSVAEGPAGGAVSRAGVYTAPNQAGTYHVVAVATEGAMTMRVSATVIVSVAAPAPTPTPTPLGHGLGGAWVLRDTRTRLEKIEDDQFDKHQVTGTGGSASTRLDWRSRTDNRSGTVTSTSIISPAAPPPRLVPGTNLEFKLERTLNTGGEPNKGAGVGIYLYWEPGGGPDGSGTISTPSAETGSPNWSRVWNWKVPDKRNAKMHVQFTSSGPGGSVQTDYIYEWVE